jgi:hypothetical protein
MRRKGAWVQASCPHGAPSLFVSLQVWVVVEGEQELWHKIITTLPFSLRGRMVLYKLSGPLGEYEQLFKVSASICSAQCCHTWCCW